MFLNIYDILILSFLLGLSMKTTDLHNEHGAKLFKKSSFLFGILTGILGSLLLLGPTSLAIFWSATFLTYLIKGQVDYLNHRISALIIFLTFVLNLEKISIEWQSFIFFLSAIGITGLLNKFWVERKKTPPLITTFFRWRMHYNLIALFYSFFTGVWIVFFSRLIFSLGYEAANFFIGEKIK